MVGVRDPDLDGVRDMVGVRDKDRTGGGAHISSIVRLADGTFVNRDDLLFSRVGLSAESPISINSRVGCRDKDVS